MTQRLMPQKDALSLMVPERRGHTRPSKVTGDHRAPRLAEGAGRAGRGFIGVSTVRGDKQTQGWTAWIVRALGWRCSPRSGPCPGD